MQNRHTLTQFFSLQQTTCLHRAVFARIVKTARKTTRSASRCLPGRSYRKRSFTVRWTLTTTSPSSSGSTSAVPVRISPRSRTCTVASPTRILPPGRPHHPKPQRFALLHIAHRRRKLLPTLAPGKREKQEPVAPHPMPWGTQDGRRYRVGQDADRPGRLGIVDTRLGVVHRFALVL